MTPQIFLDALRKGYIKFDTVCFLILDECHRASGNHPYARIMKVSLTSFMCLFPYFSSQTFLILSLSCWTCSCSLSIINQGILSSLQKKIKGFWDDCFPCD